MTEDIHQAAFTLARMFSTQGKLSVHACRLSDPLYMFFDESHLSPILQPILNK